MLKNTTNISNISKKIQIIFKKISKNYINISTKFQKMSNKYLKKIIQKSDAEDFT